MKRLILTTSIAASLSACGTDMSNSSAANSVAARGNDSGANGVAQANANAPSGNTADPAMAGMENILALGRLNGRGGMAGCFDPNLSGFPREQAERIGGRPCGPEDRTNVTQDAAQSGDNWTGVYAATIDGERQLVRIGRLPGASTVRGASRYTTDTATPGCNVVPGSGFRDWDGADLVQNIPTGTVAGGDLNADICTQRFSRRGNTLQVSYSRQCAGQGIYGERCLINPGTYTRVGGAD